MNHTPLFERQSGNGRVRKVCKNPAGKTRNSVTSRLTSSPYLSALNLINKAGMAVFSFDPTACGGSLQKIASLSQLNNVNIVVEHVWELQTFFQSMIDGILPGKTPSSLGSISWAPFDTTNPGTATFYSSWASLTTNAPQFGQTVYQTFYEILGTATNVNNFLRIGF
jgi:hypothetical protein